ncbi:carbohydrate ABC transporter permease [Streptomyces rugosispiralis]|uniref:Sugar ABC transporter permease n=1 Tax=Streptomyces rugosispiralis TaxID=2967341 RepID=A0ABT1VA38_9ACTN|nr:sugar ABC transporter permease [Streptomyces rugosispiralis]MCQ8193366.1 sugar ABC transporter permease [Streptomyces rugosispiralis]
MCGNVPPLKRAGPRRPRLGPWLTVPTLLLIAVFLYWPLGRGIWLSTRGTDLLGNPTRSVGFDNYTQLLTDSASRRVLLTTLILTVASVAMATAGALAAVLPLRRRIVGRRVFQLVFSLPFAYSAASASACFAGLFAPSVGTLNHVLAKLGYEGPPWLQSPGWAMLCVALATAWYEFGFAVLVLTAAVRNLPPEVLEAAELDGASGLRLVRSVIVPLISPSLFFLAVTQTISGLQIFTQVQVLTRGGPSDATTTLVVELYQRAFGGGVPDYGRASAIAVVLLALVLLVTAVQFLVLNRRVTTS